MDNYLLRTILFGQLLLTALMALTADPAAGLTYIQAILLSLGAMVALDTTGLTVAYLFRRRYTGETVSEFFKDIW